MKVLQFPSAYAPGERPYDIFKDRMAAISSIVSGIKEIFANKYTNNQMQMIADNILNKIDEDKSSSLIGLINEKPSEDIYPAGIEDTITQFIDKYAVGPAMQKEMMMGGLPAAGITPTPTTPTTPETMVPKQDISSLYSAISGMPSGQVNWANLMKTMTEKKPWFMGVTGPEQTVLSQMMGQVQDPKAKMTADINLAKLAKETFYPETEEEKITSEIDFFRKDPAGYSEMLKLKQSIIGEKKTAWETEAEQLFKWYQDDIINLDEFKKGMDIYIPPEKRSDFDKKFELAKNMNLTVNEWKKFFGVYLGEEEGEVSKVQYYKTSAECVATAPKIEGFTVDPTLDKTKGWYPNYVKETKVDPNSYLFGKKDVYGNISSMGIIPYDAQSSISYGQPLTDIQKTQIRNNHKLQKSLIDERMLPQVEAILKQMGVPLEVEVVLPTGKQSLPGEAPKEALGEIPAMKVTDESKLAMIPTMTDDELYDALSNLYDPSDSIYKALYDEAVKRGLIPK